MKHFFFLMLVFSTMQAKETKHIPPVFHWFHLENSPLSAEEIESIRSWQIIHPNWKFKLWTNYPCSLKSVQICPIGGNNEKLSCLRKRVLQKEGGVSIHPDLIGCKRLDSFLKLENGFQSYDGESIIACPPGQFDAPKKILASDFILPEAFTTKISASLESREKGACFWRFKDFPSLTEELRKLHAKTEEDAILAKALFKKLSNIKHLSLAIFVLALLNALFVSQFYFLIFNFLSKFRKFLALLKGHKNRVLLSFSLTLPVIFWLSFKSIPAPQAAKIDLIDFSFLTGLSRCSLNLTDRDHHRLEIYQEMFTRFSSAPSENIQIPRVIHFIWGGRPFPEKSICNINSWMKFHPDWIFKFWTDDPERPLPVEGMEKHLFDELLVDSDLSYYFADSKNWGEKSDLLRYEILNREGGVYVDHDVECYRSFDSLHTRVSFYAAMEPIHRSPLNHSHVNVTNCLIGAKPGHPVLSAAMAFSKKRWQRASITFPYDDRLSSMLRTICRTFCTFDEAVEALAEELHSAVILPASCIFPDHFPNSITHCLQDSGLLFANHKWDNSWVEELPHTTPSKIVDVLALRIDSISKFMNRIFYFLLSLSFLFFVLFLEHLLRLKEHENRLKPIFITPSYRKR